MIFSSDLAVHIGDQSIGTSASASVLSMNVQGWFPLGLTGLISLLSKRLSRVFSSTTVQKHQLFSAQPSLWSNSHIYTRLLVKQQLWLYGPFFPRSKRLLISWLQSLSAVILEPKKIKSITVSTFPHLFDMKWWTRCHDFSFLNAEFLASFFTLLFHLHEEAL